MPTDKQAPRELKVTDKRIFTSDGEIRDEFKQDIQPIEPATPVRPPAEASPAEPPRQPSGPAAPAADASANRGAGRERSERPETPFVNFIEPLVMQAYMALGLLRNPYQPQAKPDPAAARQMIDYLTLLKEKTRGNLTPEEDEYLSAHLGELKLAYVQRTKNI